MGYRAISLALGLAAVAILGSCRHGADAGQSADAPAVSPLLPAGELTTVMDDYRRTYARVAEDYLSAVHWDHRITIYVDRGTDIYRRNHALFLALKEDAGAAPAFATYPQGTVVIKEQWPLERDPLQGPSSWCLMIKDAAGTDGSWRYVEIDRKGVVLDGHRDLQVVYDRCAKCHEEAKDSDYVFSSYGDKRLAETDAL